MTLRRAVLTVAPVLVAVLFSGTASAQAAHPSQDVTAEAATVVQQCIDRIGSEPLGLPVMEVRCPELPGALQRLGIRPLIIDSSRAKFDRDSLRQLFTLLHPAAGPTASVAALGPILRGLHPPPVVARSWWQRLLEWMIEHLGRKANGDFSFPWLGGALQLLARMKWLWIGIFAATIIALPIGVGYIVMREMRAMGKGSVDEPVAATPGVPAGPVESRLALLRQMPLSQRPAQLFALLITRLVAAGRLPPDRSLTHREVARRARLDDAEQRHLIESLARLAERQLYSQITSTPAGVDELLARGEDLYTTGWGRPAEP